VSLSLEHDRNAPLVFAPAGCGIDTDFPSVCEVAANRSVENQLVVLGDFGMLLESGDGPSPDQN
jgi:hypothetical protein